ncbi:MAG: O-antigen ligase family protein [Paludibacter sp.]
MKVILSHIWNSNKKHRSLILTVSVIFIILISGTIYFFSQDNLIGGIAMFVLPFPFFYLYKVFANPRLGFISVLYANYFAVGLSRYVNAPTGLLVDAFCFLTLLAVIFSQFNHKVEWKNAGKDFTIFALIWFAMTLLQLVNPETISREAWFYAMRGQALYIVLIVPLTYLIFNRPKDMDTLITLCAWFTLLAVLKGVGQKYLGVDRWEKVWLYQPGNRSTHILFGQLRVFSFFSDAGTYGGTMGYFGVMFAILGIHEGATRKKMFYYFVAFSSLFGMMISGTRSAIAVPLVGFAVYTILSKKFQVMILVGTILFAIFFILKYTSIGQGNYDIRRMRSAFAEDNPSLNVRLENRRMFGEYLKTRPFGGGVGSAGNWGMRFTPGTFLAETATDGWYIQLWAEQGIVGLTFYLIMIGFIAIKSSYLIFFRLKKPKNNYIAVAFTSGLFGLIVSSYSASSLGQMPNTIIVFVAATLISLMPGWEKEEELTRRKQETI